MPLLPTTKAESTIDCSEEKRTGRGWVQPEIFASAQSPSVAGE